MADWDDDDPSTLQDTSSKWDKVVILKHLFTLEELEVRYFLLFLMFRLDHNSLVIHHSPKPSPRSFHPHNFPLFKQLLTHRLQEDPAAMLEIKEDLREECAKVGDVTNVVLFDKEPDGVASVRFVDAEAAKACVRVRLPYFHALDGGPFPETLLGFTAVALLLAIESSHIYYQLPPFCSHISPVYPA